MQNLLKRSLKAQTRNQMSSSRTILSNIWARSVGDLQAPEMVIRFVSPKGDPMSRDADGNLVETDQTGNLETASPEGV